MQELLTPDGIAALAAAGLALLALLLLAVLWRRVTRLRAGQTVVLGEHGERDLVAHAQRLESGFRDLQEWAEEVMHGLGTRITHDRESPRRRRGVRGGRPLRRLR